MSLIEPGTSSTGSAWDRIALAYQNFARLPTDVISYGPKAGTENDYRLLGPLSGKRVLDLGCGGGQSAIACAKQGAIAIGVDISVEQLAYARRLVEQEEVRVELKHGDLAELAFQRADSVDVVFSAYALQYVPDLNRVFRQVHRVLKPGNAFVFSIPHPASYLTGEANVLGPKPDQLSLEASAPRISRSYFERTPLQDSEDAPSVYAHTVSDIFMGLIRSGYRIDVVLEPESKDSMIPETLVVRARKES